MLEKLKREIESYFQTSDIIFHEISAGRSNTNYFIEVEGKEYFLRTSITKISDSIFGGQLEKEHAIYQMLAGTSTTAEVIHYFSDPELQFLITEKLEGDMLTHFSEYQADILDLLQRLQAIDHTDQNTLETLRFTEGFQNIISERYNKVTLPEQKEILWELMHFLYEQDWDLKEELCLCHNDFRSDNIIHSDAGAKVIDLEWMVVADRYIDPVEYYVGGVFWSNFEDETEFDYQVFQTYMNTLGYTDSVKQKYIFIMKFCSNYAWLASHVSQTEKPLDIYTQALAGNTDQFYKHIKDLL